MRTLIVPTALAVMAFVPFQAPTANTEVYVTSFAAMKAAAQAVAAGKASPLLDVVNVSNNPGYDNQPSFTPDGKAVLFTSNRDGKQTDIYRYEVDRKALTQVTHTTDNEYSPLVTPDKATFSVIRVEADNANAQRLWRYNLDGSNPRLVLENVKPVGYHAWIDATHLALYILGATGAPPTLQLADTATGKAEVLASGIGRAIFVRPGLGTVTYVDKRRAPLSVWQVDLKTRALSTVLPLTDGANGEGIEDFAWDATVQHGQAVFAWGSKIMVSSPEIQAGKPRPLIDLAANGVTKITRLAVSPDGKWLAFVAEPVAAK